VKFFNSFLGVGASDITDVISNTLGGITGLLIYKAVEKIPGVKIQKFINIIAAAGTVLMILLLSLLIGV
jgi:glycopeptide antibiotics resistance protein